MVDIKALFEKYNTEYISFKFDMSNFNYCKDYINHLKKLGYYEKADISRLIYKQILETGAGGVTLKRDEFRILYSDLNSEIMGYFNGCYVMMPPIFYYKKFYRKKGDKND